MAYAYRGTALIIEKSQTLLGAVKLRHPLTREIVNQFLYPNRAAAIRYCQQNGYSWMEPVKNVDSEKLEQRI